MTPTQRGTIIAFVSPIIFGLYPAAIRGVYAAGGNAALVLIVTTWVQFVVLLAFSAVRGQRIFVQPGAFKSSLIGGAFQTASVLGFISALQFISAPLMITLLFLYPLIVLFVMVARGETCLDAATVITTLTALLGLTLVLDVWHLHGKENLIGILLALFGAAATAGRIYVFGKFASNRNPAVIGAESFAVSSVLILFIAFVQFPHAPDRLAGDVYLLLASASLGLGTLGMVYGISLLGPFRWSLYLKSEPVFTALFSLLFLGEGLRPLQYIGMIVVLGSLAVYQITNHRKIGKSAQ